MSQPGCCIPPAGPIKRVRSDDSPRPRLTNAAVQGNAGQGDWGEAVRFAVAVWRHAVKSGTDFS